MLQDNNNINKEVLEKVKFDENGLVVAIAQDVTTKKVLMQAYMTKESLEKTIKENIVTYFSRSRNELWTKGATSGDTQELKGISVDCDGDSILLKVNQTGKGACHTGNYTCFYSDVLKFDERDIIDRLAETIKTRKENPVEGSYTNYLFTEGIDKILKKVGEESAEVIIAAKNPDKEELIYESSDLIYHLLVLLEERGVTMDQIRNELLKRVK